MFIWLVGQLVDSLVVSVIIWLVGQLADWLVS
jgi:hypothetical protein